MIKQAMKLDFSFYILMQQGNIRIDATLVLLKRVLVLHIIPEG
jgi:hypothetical protein